VRALLVLPLILLACACGSTTAAPPTSRAPSGGGEGPPPAWIQTKAGSTWLGLSSYCWTQKWKGTCADAVAPQCGEPGVPDVRVQRGETVRAHLGYSATEASVGQASAPAELHGRTVSWRFAQAGAFVLFTKRGSSDASYVGCATIR